MIVAIEKTMTMDTEMTEIGVFVAETVNEPRHVYDAWDETRQRASVLARDAEADGLFVYAVTSTGIYCRPTCPSRRPRRENVPFFALPEAAAQAGYRACRRCHPEQAALRNPQVEKLVQRVAGQSRRTLRSRRRSPAGENRPISAPSICSAPSSG